MAELFLVRSGAALVPVDDQSRERIARIPRGQPVKAEVKRARNLPHHRKFFGGLVTFVAERHPVFNTREKALDAIKLAVGHVHWMPHPATGELIPIPKSISFDAMEQGEFDEFYTAAVDATLAHLIPDADRDEVDTWVEHVSRL